METQNISCFHSDRSLMDDRPVVVCVEHGENVNSKLCTAAATNFDYDRILFQSGPFQASRRYLLVLDSLYHTHAS